MAQPLDARIRAAMGEGARATTVAELIEEIGKDNATARRDFQRQDALSKSASADEDTAEAAADEAAKLTRKLVRLEAKQQQLSDRHDELMNSERRQRHEAQYAVAKANRDELVAELKERWPQLCDQIVDLIQRVDASDAECKRAWGYGAETLISAEAIARGCSGNFYSGNVPLLRFNRIRLPALSADPQNETAWPLSRRSTRGPVPC